MSRVLQTEEKPRIPLPSNRNNCLNYCANSVNEYEEFESSLRADNLPEVILVEIFRWMPFDELHRNVRFVCQLWSHIVAAHYRCPRIVSLDAAMATHEAVNRLSRHSDKICCLKICGASPETLTRLQREQWLNLRMLSLSWRRTNFGDIRVGDLNRFVDRSPEMRCLEIRECLVDGNLDVLVEKLRHTRISKLIFCNRYLVTNDVEKLYGLKHMRVFRVYCHYFTGPGGILAGVQTLCDNNKQSLESLGLYVQNGTETPYIGDAITARIASCTRLVKLDLAGSLDVSARGLRSIAGLPRLRHLKLDVLLVSPTVLAEFLGHPFARKLHGLKLFWHRRVSAEELQSLAGCQELAKLALGFVDDRSSSSAIRFTVSNAVSRMPRLRKLKLKSLHFDFCSVMTKLCRSSDLFYVKLARTLGRSKEKVLKRRLAKRLSNSILRSSFNYECKTNGVELEIILTKKINAASAAS